MKLSASPSHKVHRLLLKVLQPQNGPSLLNGCRIIHTSFFRPDYTKAPNHTGSAVSGLNRQIPPRPETCDTYNTTSGATTGSSPLSALAESAAISFPGAAGPGSEMEFCDAQISIR